MTSIQAAHLQLPLVVQPERVGADSLARLRAWLRAERTWLDAHLVEHGAVLFRGFTGLHGPEALTALATGFVPELGAYTEGQSERDRLAEGVYNSTYYPADQRITLHNELSYTPSPPRWLFFACQQPAERGGETPLLDCREFARELPTRLRNAFADREIRYMKNMHGGRGLGKSWQAHYESEDAAAVGRYLQTSSTNYEWTDSGGLRIWRDKPAFDRHPVTGAELWFNQAALWHVTNLGATGQALRAMVAEDQLPTHARFADGETIPDSLINEIRDRMWAHARPLSWQAGDILLIDNHAVAHGRNAYVGARLLYVAMA